jgi:hypothetical protein
VLLRNGKALVVGGSNSGGVVPDVDLYDPASGPAGTWSSTEALTTGVYGTTLTLLPNERALLATGWDGSGVTTVARVYNPRDAAPLTWTATASLTTARSSHTATLLPNGKVLVAGGVGSTGITLATNTSELYDYTSGSWATTSGSMSTARGYHRAILLPNGKTMLVGGSFYDGTSSSMPTAVDLYDYATDTWSTTGSFPVAGGISDFTLTVLPTGKVLVASGWSAGSVLSGAWLYDPNAGTWAATGSLGTARYAAAATLLPDGKVLIAGGNVGSGVVTASAELYDPSAGTFSATDSMTNARDYPQAILMRNGKAMVAGGEDGTGMSTHMNVFVELYDYTAAVGSKWTSAADMNQQRVYHKLALLPNGNVLAVAGQGSGAIMGVVEYYDPNANTWTTTTAIAPRQDHTVTSLPNGKVLTVGGSYGGALSNAWLFQ